MNHLEERTETFSVGLDPDADLLDAEEDLYEALQGLQNIRQGEDRENLLQAELAVMRAYCVIHDEIEDTAPEAEQ